MQDFFFFQTYDELVSLAEKGDSSKVHTHIDSTEASTESEDEKEKNIYTNMTEQSPDKNKTSLLFAFGNVADHSLGY